MAQDSSSTPMIKQYWDFRRKLPPNTLLFFRVGDFYEMFGEDAERGAEILGITLTQRSGMALAGVPYHSVQSYFTKALNAGVKIAICEQTETPIPGKLVKRALVRIITPGTMFDETQLDSRQNNFILALNTSKTQLLAAWLDVSTGEFYLSATNDPEKLLPILYALKAGEIILPDSWKNGEAAPEYLENLIRETSISSTTDWLFEPNYGFKQVCEVLKVNSLDGFGIPASHEGLGPAGALVSYLTEVLCEPPNYLKKISEYTCGDVLLIDVASTRNLEILRSVNGKREGSLLSAIDETKTAGGARLLESWLTSPPRNPEIATVRQNCVETFVSNSSICAHIYSELSYIKDISRIVMRLQNHLRAPRELGALRETFSHLPIIKSELTIVSPSPLDIISKRINLHSDLLELLKSALNDELGNDINGVIRDGFDDKLDEFRDIRRNSSSKILAYEQELQESSGIKNLRVRYTGAFGYYIEVSKSNIAKVPDSWNRRQTLVNAERYTTENLKELESKILHAEENIGTREKEIYDSIVKKIVENTENLLETANALSELDIYVGWAVLARNWDYCKPIVDDSDKLEIVQGRHPVVEQMLNRPGSSLTFVPNDTELSASKSQIHLITGPNMAGKSTYIRQVALITLLAQIGCWCPAKSAHIGVADKIFCRVGASDELSRGNSTFMVEMNETANILNNATEKSVVILDEIGRGTSTYDGLSIAWAVAEYLHGTGDAGPRTLFATHYHEMTRISETLPRLKNYCVAVKEWNDEIIFVRQVIPGAADRSYGIHVARLAGLPDSVINRAEEILYDLESKNLFLKRNPPKTPIGIESKVCENKTPASSKKQSSKKVKVRDAAIEKSRQDPPKTIYEDNQLPLF